jgi:hypothetical protein
MKIRPRFSLRMLAIVVVAFCVYLSLWVSTRSYTEPMKRMRSGHPIFHREWSPVPLIVCRELDVYDGRGINRKRLQIHRTFYVCIFGSKTELPCKAVSGWKSKSGRKFLKTTTHQPLTRFRVDLEGQYPTSRRRGRSSQVVRRTTFLSSTKIQCCVGSPKR